MTVAQVREADDGYEVMFFESARIYRLARTHPECVPILERLRRAAREGQPVRVHFAANGEDIAGVDI
jgi:hypothetical protein